MNKKIGDVIRILLGCYLIFLGVCLWIQVSKAGPTDEQLMTLFAVILIAVGIVSFLVSVLSLTDGLKGKGYFRKKKRKSVSDDTVEIRLDEQWSQFSADKTSHKIEKSPAAESGGKTEEMPVPEETDKTEEMLKIENTEDIDKTEEIESDYEEK